MTASIQRRNYLKWITEDWSRTIRTSAPNDSDDRNYLDVLPHLISGLRLVNENITRLNETLNFPVRTPV